MYRHSRKWLHKYVLVHGANMAVYDEQRKEKNDCDRNEIFEKNRK